LNLFVLSEPTSGKYSILGTNGDASTKISPKITKKAKTKKIVTIIGFKINPNVDVD
jgi:hypothetical protein